MNVEPFYGEASIAPHPLEILEGKGGLNMELQHKEGAFDVMIAFIKKIAKKVLSGSFNFHTM